MKENYVDLSGLPQTDKGSIQWTLCNNNIVKFRYRDKEDILVIIRHVDRKHVMICYNNTIYDSFSKDSLRLAQFGRLFGFAVTNNYKYEKGTIVERTNGRIQILDYKRKDKRKVKAYSYKCLICGNRDLITEGNLKRGDGCNVCSSHKVLEGFNDLWTTREDVARMITDPNQGFKYAEFSNQKVHFTCSNEFCRNPIGYRRISDVSIEGLTCRKCGDGTSYPNRFMSCLLKNVGEEFCSEVHFDWCLFPKYLSNDRYSYGVYDFVLPKRRLIIEMDSSMGHGRNVHSHSKISKEESIYRDKMKDELANKNGYIILRINCNYVGRQSRKNACIDGCINSDLKDFINLNLIDWDEIDRKASDNSLVRRICELYKEGLSSSEISVKENKHISTIIDYLKKGTELGLCDYIKYKQQKNYLKHVTAIRCVELEIEFQSLKEAELKSDELLGFHINSRSLCNALNKGYKYKGLSWEIINNA